MPTITVIRKDLERLAGHTYDLPELERALEAVKAEVKVEDESRLRIQLKDTNRPDLWSSEGVARLLKGHRTGRHDTYPFFDEPPAELELRVDPALEHIRPFIAAFACEGIAVDEAALEQLIEAQEKLADGYGRGRSAVAIGIYNAAGTTFPVHYTAADPEAARFVPLGMETEMNLRQILRMHPTGETYAHLLQGFDKYPLISDSRGKVLSMPPVINSRNPGAVEVGDTFLFCEATGTELDAVLLTVAIMAANMADRGGRILPVDTIYPYDTPRGREVRSPLDMTEPVAVALDDLRNVIGGEIDSGKVEAALAGMGYRNITLDGKRVQARPAPYRDDILHPVDIIEDVIVSVGFDNFEPEMPHDFTVGKSAPEEDLADRIRGLMVGCGFQELFLPILSSRADLTERMRNVDAAIVEISNPMTDKYSAVRNALLPGLLRVERASRKAPYPHHIFEVGEVSVIAPDDLYGTRTEIRLSALEAHAEANLSGIQSHLEALAYYLGFDYSLTPCEHPTFLPGRAGEIRVDGKIYGIIGEIHPEVLESWGISVPASAFEVNIDIARIQP